MTPEVDEPDEAGSGTPDALRADGVPRYSETKEQQEGKMTEPEPVDQDREDTTTEIDTDHQSSQKVRQGVGVDRSGGLDDPPYTVKNGLSRPDDLGERGAALWDALTGEYVLDPHEVALLHEAGRTLDLLDELQKLILIDGPVLPWGEGVRSHPAAVEARQHRIALARLLGALAVPESPEETSASLRYRRRLRGAS